MTIKRFDIHSGYRPIEIEYREDGEFFDADVAEQLYSALQKALNFIEATESELGIKLDCGNLARAAIKDAQLT